MTRENLARPSRRNAARTALIAVLITTLLGSGSWTADIATAAENHGAVVASIDIVKMMETVETLQAFGSREFHLESSRQAADYLQQAFEDIGVPAELQYFTVGDAQVSNVVATIVGSDQDAGMYLFGAHYDSENSAAFDLSSAENLSAPGADDDASGVAAVLEMARVLSESGFPATVKFVMFGAEEYGYDNSGGLKGSEYFAAQEAALGRNYSGTAALDMIGYRSGDANRAVLVVEKDGYALAKSTAEAVGRFGIDLSLKVLVDSSITYSDHSSFWHLGMPSMLVIEELDDRNFPLNPRYHTTFDTADRLYPEQLEAVTKALVGGLLMVEEGDDTMMIFGIVIMSAAIVSFSLFIHIRRRRGRV